jgi:RNA polymerase-binding transcription factor DksA
MKERKTGFSKKKKESIDFSGGFPLMVVIKATGERAQIVEYIPVHPPRYRIKNLKDEIKEVENSEIELADEMTPLVPAKKKLRPLSPAIKNKIRKRLLAIRLKIQKEQWKARKEQRPLEEAGQTVSGNHPAEADTDLDSPRIKQQVQNYKKRLWKIDLALIRLDQDLYGLCQDCGGQIPLGRLEKVPETSHCLSCKEVEQPHSGNRPRKKLRR